ncbi:hypothetical protein ABKN59_006263 [Abortiporus biennis]
MLEAVIAHETVGKLNPGFALRQKMHNWFGKTKYVGVCLTYPLQCHRRSLRVLEGVWSFDLTQLPSLNSKSNGAGHCFPQIQSLSESTVTELFHWPGRIVTSQISGSLYRSMTLITVMHCTSAVIPHLTANFSGRATDKISKNPKNLRLNEGALQAPARKEPDVPTTAGKSATMHHLSPNPQGHLSDNPPDAPKTPSSGGSLFSANGFAEPGQSSSVSLESSMFGEVEPPSSSNSEFSLASSMFAPGPPTKQQSPTKQHSPDSPTKQHSPHQRDFSSTKTPPRPQTP